MAIVETLSSQTYHGKQVSVVSDQEIRVSGLDGSQCFFVLKA